MNKSKKILIISLIILFILLIILGVILVNKFNLFGINKVGNSMGNIKNYGYVAEDNKYIYFMSPDEDGNLKGISKIDKNLEKEPKILIKGDWDITGINIYKDYIYFVTLAQGTSESDTIDNKIHKMKKDGSSHIIINDNNFHNSNYEIYVVKDKVYYIGEDECIYTMNLDGSKNTRLNDKASGFVGINEKYIVYNVEEGTDEESNIVTYLMKLDGTDEMALTGNMLYYINIINEEFYFLDMDRHIFKGTIGNSETTILSSDSAYCFNVSNDGIYYLKYVDEEKQAIYRMDLDGNNKKKIKTLETASNFLAILDDWIVYLDSNDTSGIIAMVSKDGKKYQELYSLEFESVSSEVTNLSNTVSE